jgi:hypothetical protein
MSTFIFIFQNLFSLGLHFSSINFSLAWKKPRGVRRDPGLLLTPHTQSPRSQIFHSQAKSNDGIWWYSELLLTPFPLFLLSQIFRRQAKSSGGVQWYSELLLTPFPLFLLSQIFRRQGKSSDGVQWYSELLLTLYAKNFRI